MELISKIKLKTADVYLENLGLNKGKVTITTHENNYSMFWGAMGGTIEDFISIINSDYFSSKLLGSVSGQCFDVKSTFATLRKHIREEMVLRYWKHMEFQKHMREELNKFQSKCEEIKSEVYFVESFHNNFIDNLDFHLIDDKYDREEMQSEFEGISEVWYFIQKKENKETLQLKKVHSQLKEYIEDNASRTTK